MTERVIRVERFIRAPGGRLGDVTVTQGLITNKPKYGKAIGTSVSTCTFLGKGNALGKGTSYCAVVYRLNKGLINATGLIGTARSLIWLLSITGGSGYYAGVGGTVQIRVISLDPRRARLFFQLIGQ